MAKFIIFSPFYGLLFNPREFWRVLSGLES